MPRIKTRSIAEWNPQKSGKERRDLINKARSAVANEQRGGDPAPLTMDVPDHLAPPPRRAGRPRLGSGGAQTLTITLRPEDLEKARAIGQGNASAGIRRALETYQE